MGERHQREIALTTVIASSANIGVLKRPPGFAVYSAEGGFMPSFPIYILDFDDVTEIVFPPARNDIGHTEFWENTIAARVAKQHGLPVTPLKNLPYCQRRARIVTKTKSAFVLFGEKQTKPLLKQISEAVSIARLAWRFDEHESRLPFDVAEFHRLLAEFRKATM